MMQHKMDHRNLQTGREKHRKDGVILIHELITKRRPQQAAARRLNVLELTVFSKYLYL